MNTPAHIAASLLVWRKQPGWKSMVAIVFGAALPDLPMFGFYIFQKFVGSTERQIWSELYFDQNWQLFFDIFNSIPLAFIAMAIFVRWNRPYLWLIAASALLHLLCDFPVHHDDAHRHFLPLTNWRFESPVSYWDSKYFGRQFAAFELLFALGTSLYLMLRAEHVPMRVAGGVNLGAVLLRFDDHRHPLATASNLAKLLMPRFASPPRTARMSGFKLVGRKE